jgi:hypothetical protein
MRKIIARVAGALGLAVMGFVAAGAATAHADTSGINITFGGVTYSCNPCTSTSAKTTTTFKTSTGTQTFSTNATTSQLYLKNTATNTTGTTSTNWYAGDLGLWGGQKVTTTSGTTGYQTGYYTDTGTIKTTTTSTPPTSTP